MSRLGGDRTFVAALYKGPQCGVISMGRSCRWPLRHRRLLSALLLMFIISAHAEVQPAEETNLACSLNFVTVTTSFSFGCGSDDPLR